MLILLLVALVVGYYLGQKSNTSQASRLSIEIKKLKAELAQINQRWANFVAAYKEIFTDKNQKAVVDRMLDDLKQQGYVANSVAAKPQIIPLQNNQVNTNTTTQKPQDNALLLLYFGAFLFLSAVGLFLAFSGVNGKAKATAVGGLVFAFYFTGLWLYKASRRLKPAGTTFIAIGLILIPLYGLALFNYWFDKTHGPSVWLAVSILAILMYWYALQATKEMFIAYFYLASLLSLFEAGVSIINLPAYYFGWCMTLLGIGYMSYLAFKGRVENIYKDPLYFSSGVFVPLGVIISFALSGKYGTLQLAMNFDLAAAYYALAAFLEKSKAKYPERAQYILVSNISLLSSIGLLSYYITSDIHAVAVGLLGAGILQLAVYAFANNKKYFDPISIGVISFITFTTPLVASLFLIDSPRSLCLSLVAAVIIGAWAYAISRTSAFLAIIFAVVILLPTLFGQTFFDVKFSAAKMCYSYSLLLLALVLTRTFSSSKFKDQIILKYSYYLTGLVLLLYCISEGAVFGGITIIGLSLLAYFVSYLEKMPEIVTASSLLPYLAAGLIINDKVLSSNTRFVAPVVYGIIALFSFLIGLLTKELIRAKILRFGGIIGFLLGASSFILTGTPTWFMVVDLALAGVLLCLEASKEASQQGIELGGAIIMGAFQWSLYMFGLRTFQVYSHFWAALLGIYATWRSHLGKSQDAEAYTIAALLTLTVPLALQSLGNSGEFWGWLLIAEQIFLILFGMIIKNWLVTKWGLITAILAILYQLRQLTFVALGLIAVGIVSLAIYMLNKRTPE